MKGPEGQLARWLEQEFDFEVVHRRGSCHQNADAFTGKKCVESFRNPCVIYHINHTLACDFCVIFRKSHKNHTKRMISYDLCGRSHSDF